MSDEQKREPTETPAGILEGLTISGQKFLAEVPGQKKGSCGVMLMGVYTGEGTQISSDITLDGPSTMVADLGVALMEKVLDCAELAAGKDGAILAVVGMLTEAKARRQKRAERGAPDV